MRTHDLALVDDLDPRSRREETRNPFSPVIMVLTLLSTAGVILYAFFLLNPANRGDWLPYILVISAETILIVHALLAMWTIIAGWRSPRNDEYYLARREIFGGRIATVQVPPTASWPLKLGGETIGSFCVVDTQPRHWSSEDLETLQQLAISAGRELSLHHAVVRRPVRPRAIVGRAV